MLILICVLFAFKSWLIKKLNWLVDMNIMGNVWLHGRRGLVPIAGRNFDLLL